MKLKITVWTIFIITFVSTAYLLADTFALFENETDYQTNINTGAWLIKISNAIISTGTEQNITVDSFNYTYNEKVANNTIAPGSSAYFDLVVDATDCDVAVLYQIDFLLDSVNFSDNISVNVSEVGGSSATKTGINSYAGIIDINKIENDETITLRVTVTWEDSEVYNTNDTALGLTPNSKLAVPIRITAKQYLGDEISEYSE